MKRLSLAFAAFVPLVAVAGGGGDKATVDQSKLQKAMPATALLDGRVQSGDEVLGRIENIAVSADGQIAYFVVEDTGGVRERELAQQRRGLTDDDQRAWSDESDVETGEDVAESDRRAYGVEAGVTAEDAEGPEDAQRAAGEGITVQAESIRFDDANGEVTVTAREMDDQRVAGGGDEVMVSELIGMDVNLADADSFGEVEEVMISDDGGEVVALVVDNWEGLDKQRRALPMEGVQFGEDSLSYSLTKDEVTASPEFSLEERNDDGWNMGDQE